jgi:hypothetical protein
MLLKLRSSENGRHGMTDESKTLSPEEQLNNMLRDLLSKPGVKEKASSLLNIVSSKTPVGKKETIHHSVKNYVNIEITTMCITCSHKEVRTVLFSKKESISFVDKAGNAHVVYFNNIDTPTAITSYTTSCSSCREYLKALEREALEEMLLDYCKIASISWSLYNKEKRELAKRPPEKLDPIKFPPIKKSLYQLSEEEFKQWLDEPEEENCGEIFTEGLRTDTSNSSIDDLDSVPDGESLPEEFDDLGGSTERQDDGEDAFPWADCLSTKRDATADGEDERGDSEGEDGEEMVEEARDESSIV